MQTNNDFSLENWLRASGFTENPFLLTDAETDSHLEEYFVEPDGFGDILGDAKSPKSAVLFAPRGSGKTASRVIVDRWSRAPGRLGGNVLNVTYTVFDSLVGQITPSLSEGYIANLNVHHHAIEIMKAAMVRLLELFLAEPDLCYRAVNAPFDAQAHIAHWLKHYAHNHTQAQCQCWVELLRTLPHEDFDVQKIPDSPVQDFYTFVSLIRALGKDAVYVLVDRVDELSPTPITYDPLFGVLLLAPLISHLTLLEHESTAFKFFLPTSTLDTPTLSPASI